MSDTKSESTSAFVFPLHTPESLAALHSTGLLDSPPEEVFDRLTRLVCRLLHVPVSLISLVETDRQFFKTSRGLAEPWASQRETPLSHSFCQHVVAAGQPLVISDARAHPLVSDNRAIEDLNVVSYLGIPLRTPDGQVIGSLCAIDHEPRTWTEEDTAVLADLAETVMTEIALRLHLQARDEAEHTVRFQAGLLDAVEQAVIATDREGKITYWNRYAEHLYGWRAEEVLGRNVLAVTPAVGNVAQAAEIMEYLQQGESWSGEFLVKRRDGSTFPASVTNSPIPDETGRLVGVVGISMDITPRKQAEAEQAQLLARFEAEWSRLAGLFQQAPAFIATLRGPNHIFELANPLYLDLVSHREILGKPLREALPEVEGQGYIELLDQVYTTAEPFAGNEMRLLLERDEVPEEHYVNFVYQPMRELDGSVSGVFVHGVDVTQQVRERQRVEELAATLEDRVQERTQQVQVLTAKLALAEQEERRRLAQVLHDHIQQVLYGIQFRTNLIELDLDSQNTAKVQESLAELKQLTEVAIAGTRDLAHQLNPPILETSDVKELLAWLSDQMQALHGLHVNVMVEDELQLADKSSRVLLFHMVRELLFNVVKHADVLEVAITVAEVEGHVQVSIRDDGRGFDPSQRLAGGAREQGLGLAGIRDRLQVLRGELQIRSALGQGTEIVLSLPQ